MKTKQLSIFDYVGRNKIYKIRNKVRLIELFAGIGSQAMALRDLKVDFEHYRVIEFDKYAIDSYNAIHNTEFTPTDITTVSGVELGIKDTDTFTYLLTRFLVKTCLWLAKEEV